MSNLLLTTPALASSIRQVAGNGVNYYGFPSVSLSSDGTYLYCAYKLGVHGPYPPQAVKFIKRPIAFGSSWTSPVTIWSYDNGLDHTPTDPTIFTTSTGRILAVTTFVNNGGSFYRKPHIAYSDNGGTNWTDLGASTQKFDEWDSPCGMMEFGGNVYLSHYGRNTGDVGFYRAGLTVSTDDGGTWSASDQMATGGYWGLPFEEPGVCHLSDGRVVGILRTDTRGQLMLTAADTIGGTWRSPTSFARGYGKAAFALFPDDKMLFCQRWPSVSPDASQPVAFYTAKLGTNGVVYCSKPAFLDSACVVNSGRRQMYGGACVLNSSTAIAVWAHDDGTYSGECTIYEAEIAV